MPASLKIWGMQHRSKVVGSKAHCHNSLCYQEVFQEFLEDVSTVFLQTRNCRRELQDPPVLSLQTNLSLLSQSRGDPLHGLKNLKPSSR